MLQTYITETAYQSDRGLKSTKNPKGIPQEATCSHNLDILETSEQSQWGQGLQKQSHEDEALARITVKKNQTNEYTRALAKLDSPLKDGYVDAHYCSNLLLQDGTNLSAKRCRRKWCKTCASIRANKLSKGYEVSIAAMKEPVHLTVTTTRCEWDNLPTELRDYNRAFQYCRRTMSRKHAIEINGIRSLEITANESNTPFHPHFHIIIEGTLEASIFTDHWIEFWDKNRIKGYAQRQGQQSRMLQSIDEAKEAFKYTTKMDSKTEFLARAQDWIYQCTKNKRMSQPFGNVKKAKTDNSWTTTTLNHITPRTEIWIHDKAIQAYISPVGELLVSTQAVNTYIQNKAIRSSRYKTDISKPKPKHHERHNRTSPENKPNSWESDRGHSQQSKDAMPTAKPKYERVAE